MRTAETSICESSQNEMTEQEKENVKNFLRTCHLPNNKRLLEEKLIDTKTYRRELIEDAFDEYKEVWNFYFACPPFVSISFDVYVDEPLPCMCKCNSTNLVDGLISLHC